MIHSGSRNLGYKVAKHYNELAEKLNARWFSAVDPKWELAFLPFNEQVAQDYVEEMFYCVEFAKTNRKIMMDNCLRAFEKEKLIKIGDVMGVWDVAHNYVSLEHHFGQNVWVHRKGATKAMAGEVGIIPGSQGTSSFIVKGLGNIHSFMSCSHGSGRKMGRKQAERELDLDKEKKFLDDQGIIHSIIETSDLDEAAGAYKDIHQVMENQKDLVEITVELKPLAVVKGKK